MEESAAAKPKTMDYVYRVSAGVANAILVCLGIGLLLQSIANFTHWTALYQIGAIAQVLLGPAFGVAIAVTLKANTLVTFSAMISSTIGANAAFFTQSATNGITATGHALPQAAGGIVLTTGQPISAVAAGLVAVLIGNYLTGKTPLDMMLVPLTATFIGTVVGLGLAAVTTPALVWLSKVIANSMQVNPLVGSMLVSLAWSIFLMTPASSAALAVAIMLDPISSGAALIGTTAQFVGFTIMSFRRNNLGANIAQGIITPKVQFANLLANPRLAIPPMVAAVVAAPIATMVFNFQATYKLAGLGLNSLIAPIALASTNMGMFWVYLLMGVAVPAVISLTLFKLEAKLAWVSEEQLHLEII